jgi:D-glycero-D-manno-heptose 1,7-bisphosphate phosphatase
MKRPAVFFDRDNTLIVSDGYLGDPAKVVLVPGAAAAVAKARQLGYAVVVFSNQSGVARGMFSEEDVVAVNARTDELLRAENGAAIIDRHEFCPFHPEGTIDVYARESDRRKPKPGMILAAADKLALDLPRSWVIGDAGRDTDAGHAAGCHTILFTDPALAKSPAAQSEPATQPDYVVGSLAEALAIVEEHPGAKADAAGAKAEDLPAPAPSVAPDPPVAPAPSIAPAPPVPSVAPLVPPKDASAEVSRPAANGAATTSPAPAPRGPKVVIGSKYVPPEVKGPARPAPSPPRGRSAAETSHDTPVTEPATAAPAAPVARPAVADYEPSPLARKMASRNIAQGDADDARSASPPQTGFDRMESTLEQIFLELRRQHEQDANEFSVSKLLAGVVQVLVLAALFFAYLRRDNPGAPGTCLQLALVLQTMTIALLIMSRQK